MNKKRIGIIAGVIIIGLAMIASIIFNQRASEIGYSESDLMGVWYSEGIEGDELALAKDGIYSSSTLFAYGKYSLSKNGQLQLKEDNGGNLYFLDVEQDESGQVVRLVSTSSTLTASYRKDKSTATQVAAENGASEYAAQSAEMAIPKILATGSWARSASNSDEILVFDISKVSLTWVEDGVSKTAKWALIYKGFKVENILKPIEAQIELQPTNDVALKFGDTRKGYLYLDTSDTNAYSFTSDVFPNVKDLSNNISVWEQHINEDLLIASDDSYQEGENVYIATDGTYNAATEDPFSNSYIEPAIGSIDPDVDKVIDVYSRVVSGDYCYIRITYTDGTTSRKTIQRQVQVAPQEVEITYPD